MDIAEAGPKLHKELQAKFPEAYLSCGISGYHDTLLYVFLKEECPELDEYFPDNKYEGWPVQWRVFRYGSGTEYDSHGYVFCENEPGLKQTPRKKAGPKKKAGAKKSAVPKKKGVIPKKSNKKPSTNKPEPKKNTDDVDIEFID